MSDEYYSPEGEYLRRVLRRRRARSEVAAASWFGRRRAREQLRELEQNDDLDEAAQRWARSILLTEIANAWARTSRHSNEWHPRLLEHLPSLAEEAAAEAVLQAGDDELLHPLLTAAAAEQLARENVERVRRVVDNPTIYLLRTTTPEGNPMTVLQHAASGLRGRFAVDPDDGFGTVFSKPYDIPSINPDNPHDDGNRWELYAGLGIGRRLYLTAAELHPNTRWRAGIQSPYAAPLRTRLHNADPYHWGANCTWCNERRIIWRDADQTELTEHPITPAPAAIAPRIIEVTTNSR